VSTRPDAEQASAVETTGPVVVSEYRNPIPLPPTFQDRVRFQIAVGMLFGMAILAALLIVCVATGWMAVGEAKELALMVVALFGIVAPIIGFYFAAKERG
jgi:cytochrome bd-type quinol oxidase subunit 1